MDNSKVEPHNGILTDPMDFGTKGFDEFQVILLDKSKNRSISQKRNIELLTLKYQMEDYLKSIDKEVIPAGEFLKLFLKSLKIQQNKFANYIGIKPSNLSKLIRGERPINYNLALIFGKIFNHNPMLWIEIQAKNELRKLFVSPKNNYHDYSLNDLISEPEENYKKSKK